MSHGGINWRQHLGDPEVRAFHEGRLAALAESTATTEPTARPAESPLAREGTVPDKAWGSPVVPVRSRRSHQLPPERERPGGKYHRSRATTVSRALSIVGRAGFLLAVGIVAVLLAGRAWSPGPDQLNLALGERIGQYETARAEFDAGRLECAGLAQSYAAADEARIRAAVGYARIGGRAETILVHEHERLTVRVSAVDSHFDGSSCPRP
jgi:hypothetical protein